MIKGSLGVSEGAAFSATMSTKPACSNKLPGLHQKGEAPLGQVFKIIPTDLSKAF